ncbi:MAG: hypothetical protein L6R39_003352 [Caloplaca ligustica]|nr:MAG: hypothetical protein L6R39_003352 [Caloplaca ligustica]
MALEFNIPQPSQASSTESTASNTHGRRASPYQDSLHGSRSEHLRDSTPSTSLSNQSSQQRTRSPSPVHANNVRETGNLPARLSNSPPYTSQRPTSQPTDVGNASPYKSPAAKRTSSGHIKPAENGHGTSASDGSLKGHSRNTSTASKSSQVSELSHELRTRLSYAMFKVQNGWQSHNLNELEAMTLPGTTHTSAITQLQQAAASPVTASTPPKHYHSSPTRPSMAYEYPYSPPTSTRSPPLRQPGAPDAGFMQDHATGHVRDGISPQHTSQRGPSLAPPADILPRNSRQPQTTNMRPPRLNTTSVHSNGANDLSPHTGPSTPSRRPASTIRTPSQKADAEKDAVETLMFMSSPGNSGYHPAAFYAPQPSPIRDSNTPIMSPTKKVGFASSPKFPSRTSVPGGGRLTTMADIDRVLDEMPDAYSSSDES